MALKKLVLLSAFLFINTTAFADTYSKEEKSTNFIVTPSIAYRYDVFKWVLGDHYFPGKKASELIWKNRVLQPSIKIELEPQPNQFTILGQVKYGYILKNQSKSWDHDWDLKRDRMGNVTSKLVSTSKSQATGNILDLSGAVGYSVNLFKDSLFTFYFGYDYSDYRNKNYGYHQLIYKRESFSSDELLKKYNFKTQSPWVGLSINTLITDRFQLIPTIKFYSFKHVGKGYWIYRPDLKQDPSLKNIAKGKGIGFDLDFIYKYSNNLHLILNLEAKNLKMKKEGTSKMFFNSRGIGGEGVETIKLLDLNLRSSSISAGLQYKL